MSADAAAIRRGQAALLAGAVLLGVTLGWAGARPLSPLGAGNLLVWAVAVVALGMRPGTAGGKVVRLGAFGVALGLSFMAFGDTGSDPLSTKLLPFTLIGLVCGLCAVALGGIVHLVLSLGAARRHRGEGD